MLTSSTTCVECGAPAPEKDGDAFLSSSSGWRLLRRKTADGEDVLDWRCPVCWIRHKSLQGPGNYSRQPPGKGK